MGVEELISISKKAYISEADALKGLEPYLAEFKARDKDIKDKARRVLERIKSRDFGFTQKMLAAYPIKSASGRAIMSLAESLVRVPDKETAFALIDDKIKGMNWKPSASRTALVAAVELALSLAGKTGANLVVFKALCTCLLYTSDAADDM
jgi:RHH-type proline utilization regulon transcriptional repressor/proline dehydrogenase/delta 1-pyrroline-5-carboxylate dehydrogenase